jgi:hypothetical protein
MMGGIIPRDDINKSLLSDNVVVKETDRSMDLIDAIPSMGN